MAEMMNKPGVPRDPGREAVCSDAALKVFNKAETVIDVSQNNINYHETVTSF